MTLPASGAISFNDINVELGRSGTTQASLNDSDLRSLAGVPSGQIDLNDFWGKSSYAASLPASFSISDTAISPTNALTGLGVYSDGTWETLVGGLTWETGTWKTGGGTGANYEVRLTKTSGNTPTGTAVDTWFTLSANNAWYVNETRDGFFSSAFTGTLEIRLAASPFTVLDSALVDMTAIVEI